METHAGFAGGDGSDAHHHSEMSRMEDCFGFEAQDKTGIGNNNQGRLARKDHSTTKHWCHSFVAPTLSSRFIGSDIYGLDGRFLCVTCGSRHLERLCLPRPKFAHAMEDELHGGLGVVLDLGRPDLSKQTHSSAEGVDKRS